MGSITQGRPFHRSYSRPEGNLHALSRALLFVALLAGSLFPEVSAAAPVDLTGGVRAVLVDKDQSKADQARFVVKDDRALVAIASPLCPVTSQLRLVSSAGDDVVVPLDCSRWRAAGPTLLYLGTGPSLDTSGVRRIRYGIGRLDVSARGQSYSAQAFAGPISWLETSLVVGGQVHCGRWELFRKNDGQRVVAQGPTAACQVLCGDGDLDAPYEQCEDGNAQSGDGCDSRCRVETCGDGTHSPPLEGCDDGNSVDGDGCDSNCTPTACGNGVLSASTGEQCDDGNTADGDGCRANCTLPVCGDGLVDAPESCDDGNTDGGDCCSSSCQLEVGPCDDGNNCTEDDVCQAGVCTGALIQPWINEIDYDNYVSATTDREEFVEIAGPAGLDLGGYTLYGVEGATGTCQTPGNGLLSGPVLPGYVHWSYTIPAGTVLSDDTGSGVGFLVVCNTPSSLTYINAGKCDLVFPGISSESNFQNGSLLNEPSVCPDGVLLLGPDDAFADAVSYEGVVPSVGPLGPFFHVEPPYDAGADEGWKPKTSLEKWTSHLGRAANATEWRDSGGCTDQCIIGAVSNGCDWINGLDPCLGDGATPGESNSGGQRYICYATYCGDGIVTGDEQCDEGAANSDEPHATCRTDCRLRRCGDGIVDPAVPGFPEGCERDTDCAAGQVCAACQCTAGAPLGDLEFTVVPGSSATQPPDDGESTWLRINQPLPALLPIITGSNGQWTAGPLRLTAGAPDASGVARFNLAEDVLLYAPLPALAGGGKVCFKLRPDYDRTGLVDCDGGSNVDAELTVNSNGSGAASPPSLRVGAGVSDSGAGAAVAYVLLEAGTTGDDTTPCQDAVYRDPVSTALTTGVSTSVIQSGLVIGAESVSLAGQPLDCTSWIADAGASIAMPNFNLDVPIPVLGVQDVAQVLRLNDD